MASSDSVSISVLKRILMVLDDIGGGISRTSLSAKTGLNYGTCIKYLKFLALLGCVSFRFDSRHVSITETGRSLMSILQKSNNVFDAGSNVRGAFEDSAIRPDPILLKEVMPIRRAV